ncbi:MAG: uncharacterized protein QOD24_4222, partial [Solirubrobacteraceae bacterium]|nr:uncharacterized protein [Solirubrobacteraceae bacterium]
ATRCDAVALSTSSPANGATGVPGGSDITLTFSKPVSTDPGFATVSCDSGPRAVTVSGGPTTYTLDPDSDFAADESCTVTVDHTKVRAADDPSNELPADRTITFRTQPAPTAIHDIQGAAHISPLKGQTVRALGIVTARRNNGFWMQGTDPDGDPATSEGIFVFTGSAPAVSPGDGVDVTGRVQEFRPGATGLTITELTSPAVTTVSSGNALPAPQLVGPGGRMPSDTIVEDDATDVELGGVFDVADGIDFYESLEGMRVQVDDAVASGPTDDFGSNREIPVLPGGGASASVRTPRGGIVVRPNDFNPERIILNDALAGPTLPSANVGDSFPGATVGVMDYSFSNYKLETTTLPAEQDNGLQRETATAPGVGELSFATFNVQNLDPGDGAAKFDRLAKLIVDNLRAPDLLSVEEVQDDNGATDDGTISATETLRLLTDAIAAAGGPEYHYAEIDPVNDRDGGEPGGNIRVVFLYRTDRGLGFAPRGDAGSTQAVQVGDGPSLDVNPGRIQPSDPAFNSSRKPLAGEFTYDGQPLFVVANHWNSKGGDQPLYGPHQPPTLSSESQRVAQAQIVHDFVGSIVDRDPAARVVVLGDLNDFPFSKPLQTLTAGGSLEDLITRLPAGEQYTYDFEGNSQVLDHVAMTPAAASRVRSIDAVHVNSEFADQASDHDPLVAVSCADITAPSLTVSLSQSSLSPPNHKYVRVTASTPASDTVDPSPSVTLVSAVSSEPDDAPGDADGTTTHDVSIVDAHTFDLRAERDERGTGRTYAITYRATDACGNSVTRTGTVRVPADRG